MNYSWGASVTNCCDNRPFCLYNLGDQLLVSSLSWYMRVYRLLLSYNNSPLFCLPRLFRLQICWEQFSCIRGYIIRMNHISIARQWLSSTLDNSDLQTTCHNILIPKLQLLEKGVFFCTDDHKVISINVHKQFKCKLISSP
jgi:hypothetical protein